MRKYIDILNESLTTEPVLHTPMESARKAPPAMLEEGVRETVEGMVDKAIKMFSPKHVTYEAACTAIDRINELTDGKGYISYTKADLLIGGKLAQDVAATVVALSLSLAQIHNVGVAITASIVSAAVAAVSYGLVHIRGAKRGTVMGQAARAEARSPAPVARDKSDSDSYDAILANVAGIMKK